MARRKTRWFAMTFLLVVALTALYVVKRDILVRRDLYFQKQNEVLNAQKHKEALETQVNDARARVRNLNSDPVEKEASVRRTKNLVRENEKVYRLEEVEMEAAQNNPSGGATPAPASPAPEVSKPAAP